MGASYSLKILIDDKELTANTSIPYRTKLDSVTSYTDAVYYPKEQFYIPKNSIYFSDTSLAYNKFEFFSYQVFNDFSDTNKIYVEQFLSTIFWGEIDYKIKEDLNLENMPRSLLFTDKYFNGKSIKITYDANFLANFSVLRTLSPEYYQYKQNYYAHLHSIELNNDGGAGLIKQILFSSEPIKMYSNIKGGGYGVFAGFSQDTVSTIIYK
jgi:hypothetical protein